MAHHREADWKRLMLAARAGNECAYRAFLGDVSRHLRQWAQGALTRAGRSLSEAEDIVQETLIAIHLKRHTWDSDQPVGPWLHGIARHKLIDALRRRGGHDHLDIEEFAEIIPAPNQEAEGLGLDLARMMDSLPERQATITRALMLEGQRAADVGARLGMSEGAVRVALHRALKLLASRFGSVQAAAGEAARADGRAPQQDTRHAHG